MSCTCACFGTVSKLALRDAPEWLHKNHQALYGQKICFSNAHVLIPDMVDCLAWCANPRPLRNHRTEPLETERNQFLPTLNLCKTIGKLRISYTYIYIIVIYTPLYYHVFQKKCSSALSFLLLMENVIIPSLVSHNCAMTLVLIDIAIFAVTKF